MKQVRLSISDLKKMVQIMSSVIKSNSVLNIIECIKIDVKKNSIAFTGTDIETQIRTVYPATSDDIFNFCFSFKDITDLCKQLGDGDITIQFTNETKTIKMSTEQGVLQYGVEDPEMFPTAPEIENPTQINLNKDILEKVKIASNFASTDTLRPAMTGVLFDITEETLNIVATDAHCLYKSEGFALPKIETDQFIVSKNSVKCLLSVNMDIVFTILKTDTFICFESENITVFARLIDARYPDYKAVIPTYESNFEIDLQKFSNTVKLVGLSANKTTNGAVFEISGDNLNITAQDIDTSKSAVSKPITVENKTCSDFTFSLNILMLSKITNFLTRTIKVNTDSNPTRALIITDDTSKDIFLIMPLMVTPK